MKHAVFVATRATILVLMLSLSASLVPAQDPADAQADPRAAAAEAEAESQLAALAEMREKYLALDEKAEKLEGEDKFVAEREMDRLGFEFLDDLHALADNVLEQERQGIDTSGLREPLNEFMQRIPSSIKRLIDETSGDLRGLRLQREDLSAADLLEQERRIARDTAFIDTLVEALYAHIEKLEALGLDATADRQYLIDLLPGRASSLIERVKIAQEENSSLEAMLKDAPDDADLKLNLDAGTTKLRGITSNLTVTVDVMKKLGLDTTEYQRELIQVTGSLSTDILDKDVALSLAGQWLKNGKQWLADNGARLLFKIVVFILILLVFKLLANAARRVVARSLSSSKIQVSKLLEHMITSMVSKIVMLFGLLVALAQFGVSLGPLLAGFGVAGIIIGFALQDTLSNFASGMMILFYRPFDVGDLVEAGGVFGKVSKMTLVSTTFLTLDHQTLVVPNSKIWGDVIKNVTAQKIRRVDMTFGIGYDDDIPKAEKVLWEILKEHPKVLDDPEPNVKLHNLGESSVDFIVRPWVNTDDYWDVHWDITREVKMRFDAEGIGIPFPQRDVHIYEEKKLSA